MEPLTPEFARLYDGLRRSTTLEKLAAVADSGEADRILRLKANNDSQTFDLAKTAAGLAEMGHAALSGGKRLLGTPFGKGLAVAGGAAIPTMLAADHISTHAAEEARNKALQAGAGLAGIGATMYGLHRAMQPKTAEDEQQHLQEALQKLASVGYLDELLGAAEADTQASEDARKLAAEIRGLNREYFVDILCKLVG